jgi:hypothetical protein
VPLPRSEPKIFGAAQHLWNFDRDIAEPMADLFRIGADVVDAQQSYQGIKSWISKAGIELISHILWRVDTRIAAPRLNLLICCPIALLYVAPQTTPCDERRGEMPFSPARQISTRASTFQ